MFGQSALPVGGGVVAVVRQEVAVDSPVGGGVVAVVRQEVAVELPEHSQRDAAVRRGDVVIGHLEHVVELGQVEVRVEQLVRQAVTLQQRLQLLTHTHSNTTRLRTRRSVQLQQFSSLQQPTRPTIRD